MEQDKRKLIIEAAYRVLMEQGYDKSSTKEIAKQAGVAQGLINYYFKKDELLVEVFKQEQHVYCTFLCNLMDQFEAPPAFSEDVVRGIFNQVKNGIGDSRDYFKLRYELFAIAARQDDVKIEVIDYVAGCRAGIQEMIEKATFLPKEKAEPLAAIIFSAIDGLAFQSTVDSSFDLDLAFDVLADMVISYIKSSS